MRLFLIIIFVFGLFTRIGLDIGLETSLWSFPAIIAGFVLLLLNLNDKLLPKILPNIFLFLFLIFMSFFSFENGISFEFSLANFGFISYGLLMSVGFILELNRVSKEQIERFCILLVIILLSLSFIEIITPLKEILIKVREVLFPVSGGYHAFERDSKLHGGYRPMLLTQEPSHLAITLVSLLTAGLIIGSKKNEWKYMALGLFSFLIVRSPICVLFFPIIFAKLILINARQLTLTKKILTLLSVSFFGLLIAFSSYSFLQNRISGIADSEGISNIGRLYIPGYLAYVSVTEKPLTGFGLSNYDGKQNEVNRFVRKVFSAPLRFDNIEELIKNAFLEHWINFGLIGGFLILYPFRRISKAIRSKNFFFAVFATATISLGITGYNDPRLWALLLTFLLISSKTEVNLTIWKLER